MRERDPRVVIIGAGFAGLHAARALGNKPVRVTVIDRKNHHTFQPLLYQVALAVLSPAQIASPVRGVLRKYRNERVLLGEVVDIDTTARTVRLREGDLIEYDYLVLAAGARHSYFGRDEWEQIAPGLKTIEDALEIRRRVLLAFELAERHALTAGHSDPLNFVIIGAGPTGVELAGAITDIARRVLRRDFRSIDPKTARVILLEGGPRVLPTYPEDLSASAEKQLRELEVEVRTDALVTSVEPGFVRVGEERIPSLVTLWAAGVAASPLGRMLNAPLDRAGRVQVQPDLSLPDHPEVFVVGDLAAVRQPDGSTVPGVAPAAMQMGDFVAEAILRHLARKPRGEFLYRDKGSMATIGRKAAVADFGKLHLSGFPAWMMWLLVHLYFLIGFRNRLLVMMEWAWTYFTFQRGARLITGSEELPGMTADHDPERQVAESVQK